MHHSMFGRVSALTLILILSILFVTGCVGNDPKVEADIRSETMKQKGGPPAKAAGKTPGS